MSTRNIVVPALVLLIASSLAGCSQSVATPPSATVAAILEEARTFPAAGDDLTMYIGDRFAEAEQRMVGLGLGAEAAPAAPTF